MNPKQTKQKQKTFLKSQDSHQKASKKLFYIRKIDFHAIIIIFHFKGFDAGGTKIWGLPLLEKACVSIVSVGGQRVILIGRREVNGHPKVYKPIPKAADFIIFNYLLKSSY